MDVIIGTKYRMSYWPDSWWIEVLLLSPDTEYVFYIDNRGKYGCFNMLLEFEELEE